MMKTYIFCRDFWFGKTKQSESISLILDIPKRKFKNITDIKSYKNIINSNIIFIAELPEKFGITLSKEFLEKNNIFFYYHLEMSIMNELRNKKYKDWKYLLLFESPDINRYLMEELNYEVIKLKFYLSLSEQVDFQTKRLGYWNKINLYNIETINKIIKNLNITEFYLYDYPNGGYSYLEDNFVDKIECNKKQYLKVTKDSSSYHKYRNFIDNCNIYLMPRLVESCGVSNLEQMSRGCLMLGMNYPSMSNYIIHNKTGFLFDDNFSNINELKNIDVITCSENIRTECFYGKLKFKKDFNKFIKNHFIK